MQRRDYLKLFGTMALIAPFNKSFPLFGASPNEGQLKYDIHIFSKVLQWLNYEDLAKISKQIGFSGVDLTVRPKGHVLPENVEKDLPKAVAEFLKNGLDAGMMTTEITDIREPYTEKILKTASSLGITNYRMGWLKYDTKKPIQDQIETLKPRFKELEQMNEHYKIGGSYQNHAGSGVGAPLWDIWLLIKDLNPRWLGCQFDIRHAMAEGLNSWELGLKLLKSNIQSLSIKDFAYLQKGKGLTLKYTPIGEGAVDFEAYFSKIKALEIAVPISLHVEYDLGGAQHGETKLAIAPEQVVAALKQDLTRLKAYL